MTREALLQKAREWRLANWRHHVPPGVADGSSDCGFFYPEETDSLLADFCLSELAVKEEEIEKLRAIIFRMSSHMDAAKAEGRNCGGIVGALVIPAGAPRCPKCGIYYPESPCIICQMRAEAALQREGPEGGKS